jgi:hypothetical protein
MEGIDLGAEARMGKLKEVVKGMRQLLDCHKPAKPWRFLISGNDGFLRENKRYIEHLTKSELVFL